MITVQSTKTTKEVVTHRHPDILKRKMSYIQNRKLLFRRIFVEDYRADKFWQTTMRGRIPSRSWFSAKAMVEGEIIKSPFGYNEKSPVVNILFHFRRLYNKLYLNETKDFYSLDYEKSKNQSPG